MPRFIRSSAEQGDYVQILQLEGLYPSTFDRGDPGGWADLFTPTGVFDHLAVGDHPGTVIEGRDALIAFAKAVQSGWQGVHVPGLPGIEIDGDVATGFVPFTWCGIRRASARHPVTRRVVGYYDVRYERGAQGWRMAYRREKGTSYVTGEDFDVS